MAKNAKKKVEQYITEIELVAIETTRLQLQQLRKTVRETEALLSQQEADVIRKLEEGVAIHGNLTAVVTKETGACRPQWKELHVKHMESEHGLTREAVEASARAAYPPSEVEVLVIRPKPATV